jgi:hypothetical protein
VSFGTILGTTFTVEVECAYVEHRRTMTRVVCYRTNVDGRQS